MNNAAKEVFKKQSRADREQAPKWDKSDLRDFLAKHDDARKAQDAKDLSRVFNLAAKVPVLKAALDWAKENDIDLIVDRTSRNVGGYYWEGSGVVTLSLPAFRSDEYLAGVVVHEIRHAWQDRYGMIPTASRSYADYNINIALIEADATAHQTLAEKQTRLAKTLDQMEMTDASEKGASRRKLLQKQADWLQAELADPEKCMWDGFKNWYVGFGKASAYGKATMNLYGEVLGIPGVRKNDYKYEFGMSSVPVSTGIDFQRPEQLRRLGKSFTAGNYLNKAGKDEFQRYMLSRSASLRFFRKSYYKSTLPGSTRTVEEIRSRELKLRAAKGGVRPLVLLGP